jgi:von Willebrand factor type A domain
VVMGQDGKIVEGLTGQNLRVRGIKAKVQSANLDTSPRRIVLLLDISGSMKEAADYRRKTRWEYAKEMAKRFLDDAPAQDFVALGVFAKEEKQAASFTHDFALIRAAIDALPEPDSMAARGSYGTETYAGEALHAAVANASQDLRFGDAVIFFSDGEFSMEDRRHSLDSVAGDLERRGVRVFLAFALGNWLALRDFAPDFWTSAVIDSSDFTALTGGFSFGPAMPPDSQMPGLDPLESRNGWPGLQIHGLDSLESRMLALCNAVQGTYRVELQLDQALRKKQRLEFEVVDRRDKPVHDLLLLYPRNFYPD